MNILANQVFKYVWRCIAQFIQVYPPSQKWPCVCNRQVNARSVQTAKDNLAEQKRLYKEAVDKAKKERREAKAAEEEDAAVASVVESFSAEPGSPLAGPDGGGAE